VRKINELVKRVRLAKVHAYICSYLKEQMPMFMGAAKKQKELLENLPQVFRSVLKKYNLAPGDFPELNDFRTKLTEQDFSKFAPLKQRLIDDADHVLGVEFPRLMEALPRAIIEQSAMQYVSTPQPPGSAPSAMLLESTASPSSSNSANPFGDDDSFGGKGTSAWALADYIPQYQQVFNSIQTNGVVTGGAAKSIMGGSGLPTASLRKIWELSDIDKDGTLDLQEFVVAMFLIDMGKKGHPMPDQLDDEMIPPEKKR
jgi:EH domain-containing protein 1